MTTRNRAYQSPSGGGPLPSRRQFLAASATGAVAAAASEKPPNYVIYFVDDLGYGDIGCFGSETIRTPRIDAMAREGMRLTSFYAQPICGPSRSAIMTGCYPMRLAERNNRKHMQMALHRDEVTLGEVLRPRGYKSAVIGKWDLAGHGPRDFLPELLPRNRGFDYHYGTPSSNSWKSPPLYRNGEILEQPARQETLTQRYTQEALRFIDENKDGPFFLYMNPNMPHVPLHVPEEFRGKSKGGLYGDVVEELDWSVGQVLDALGERGLDRNTYVIFTSDNGPYLIEGENAGSARPLRSGKVSTWEGGVRVPCVVWGPGRVPAGVTSNSLATTMDLLPTFAAMSGAAIPADRVIDGVNLQSFLHGSGESPRDTFYYYLWTHLQAVRSGKWKLHLPRPDNPWWLAPLIRYAEQGAHFEIREPLLFDLEADVGERNDVAAKHPDVVRRLLALAGRAREDIGDYDRVGKNMRFFDPVTPRPERPLQMPDLSPPDGA